jgi:alpha-L-rhamnosidase
LKGGGPEIWEPSFTYHGFQFVEVSGYPGTPDERVVTGIVVTSAMPEAGRFECSDDLVNQLYRNIVTTQLANFIEVPTDCPQRDERLGWLGDAQIFMRAASYNRDISAFFTKWLADIGDAQSPAGAYPDLAPRIVAEQDGSPGWADAGVICPWTLHHVYDDRRIIEQHYPSMKKWIDYLDEANPDHLWRHRTGNNNGEWLPVDYGTPRDVLATAYYAYSTRHLAAAAELIGRNQEATHYRQLFEKIKKAFNDAFVSPDGRVKGATQTGYVVALHFDLLPERLRAMAAEHLVADIDRRGGHLSTGFYGTGYLPSVLTTAGHLETAFRVLTQQTFPSWGYSIRQGATSIWEHWDGWRDDKGFKAPIMNSFSHYAFGSVSEWLFAAVAGIDTQGPGFRRIVIHPRIGGGLTRVEAHYDAISGRIVSAWRIERDRFFLEVTIPANTRAQVVLPTADLKAISEGETSIDDAEGVEFHRIESDEIILEVGSGDYRFLVSPFTLRP